MQLDFLSTTISKHLEVRHMLKLLYLLVVTKAIVHQNECIPFLLVSDSFPYLMRISRHFFYITVQNYDFFFFFLTQCQVHNIQNTSFFLIPSTFSVEIEESLFYSSVCVASSYRDTYPFILQRVRDSDMLFLGMDKTFLQGNRTS